MTNSLGTSILGIGKIYSLQPLLPILIQKYLDTKKISRYIHIKTDNSGRREYYNFKKNGIEEQKFSILACRVKVYSRVGTTTENSSSSIFLQRHNFVQSLSTALGRFTFTVELGKVTNLEFTFTVELGEVQLRPRHASHCLSDDL
jgi:hypothetical protein